MEEMWDFNGEYMEVLKEVRHGLESNGVDSQITVDQITAAVQGNPVVKTIVDGLMNRIWALEEEVAYGMDDEGDYMPTTVDVMDMADDGTTSSNSVSGMSPSLQSTEDFLPDHHHHHHHPTDKLT